MSRRFVIVACRMRHLSLFWGRTSVVFIWPLFPTPRSAPFFALTLPRQSGGTFSLRLGPLLLIHDRRRP